jgi:hypothetical protein
VSWRILINNSLHVEARINHFIVTKDGSCEKEKFASIFLPPELSSGENPCH